MSVRVNLRRDSGESAPVIVDDQSGPIEWLGVWANLSSGNEAINQGTLKELDAPGGGFTFEFTGSQIQVFGVVRALQNDKPYVATSSSYSIDGNELGSFTSPNLTQEADGTMFFNSGSLQAGSHQLFVSVDSVSEDYPYLLDYLAFIPAPTLNPGTIPVSTGSSPPSSSPSPSPSAASSSPPPSSSSSSSSSTSLSSQLPPSSSLSSSSLSSSSLSLSPISSTASSSLFSSAVNTALPSAAITSTFFSSSSTTKPTNAPQSDVVASHSSHIGPIVGSVTGGAFFLAVLFGLLLWCLRRRRAQPDGYNSCSMVEGKSATMTPQGGIHGITPYLLPRDYRSSPTNFNATVQPQLALGGAEVEHARSEKVWSPDTLHSSVISYGAVPGRSSPQHLLSGPSGGSALSEVSSVSGSVGATSTAALVRNVESARAGSDYAVVAQRAPWTLQRLILPGPRSGQLPTRQPPTMRGESGLLFPPNANYDEVSSQATTQPPAYSPLRER
ncbi:hypothetical protein PsYK624_103320 [Phanerochaete sordida]|uniref:Uncharacterized protein n=1 Tax=Phanerochaete sordida TaxID=48140 RepID=A0A9P3LGZ6_9APHY|nr:hypothetical protein PsYK624_103320 [Phanerochaete sordida]